MTFRIERVDAADVEAWVALRAALWPSHSIDEHRADGLALLARGERDAVFVATSGDGAVVGFAEAALRVDHVNGTSTSPVTFLEGVYVVPQWRRRGVARALCDAVERWGLESGCTEFASDALLENEDGIRLHEALGFRETERVVYFLKAIQGA
jgi:aminoglycoside 6'-N-acetyltransferase I